MGNDFAMDKWSDTWLKSSGINLLEGIAEYDKDKSIQTFAIKQSFDEKIGQNRLRK
jgi:hypothetical protein